MSQPLVVGIGGTTRVNSSSELALRSCLTLIRALGAETESFSADALDLPHYGSGRAQGDERVKHLVDSLRRCDGVVLSSPAYHGSMSGMLKNALDYVEDMRGDRRVYFDGVAVGCIARAAGWQAAGHTLATLRSIAHALRGWPTPLGVALNTSSTLFDDSGACLDASAKAKLHTVGRQVVEFALQRRGLAMQV